MATGTHRVFEHQKSTIILDTIKKYRIRNKYLEISTNVNIE